MTAGGAEPWDPGTYGSFAAERGAAAGDLTARVDLDAPRRALDLGCGSGAAVRALRERWPSISIVAVDNSKEMLAAGRRDCPDVDFVHASIEAFEPGEPFDLVVSNAALQWVPHHARLLPRLLSFVKPGGALAFQMPHVLASPLHAAAARLLGSPRFGSQARPGLPMHEPVHEYRRILEPHASRIHVWETEYRRLLRDAASVLDWFRGAGLRPYFERLTDGASRRAFEESLRLEIERIYPRDPRGRVPFPFRRFFVVAYRPVSTDGSGGRLEDHVQGTLPIP